MLYPPKTLFEFLRPLYSSLGWMLRVGGGGGGRGGVKGLRRALGKVIVGL